MNLFRFAGVTMLSLCFSVSLLAQTQQKLAFEVATIKPSPLSNIVEQAQSGKLDLAMRMDGARVDLKFLSLANMVAMAYKVKLHQIEGPEWLNSQLFEIHAKLPEGSNKEQINEMMQSLLEERFKLSLHRETKEQPVYALIVGKDGHKLKKAVEEPAAEAMPDPKQESSGQSVSIKTPDGEMKFQQERGGVVMDAGAAGKMRMTMGENGAMRWEVSKMKMSEFSDLLTQFTDRQVVDMTGLTDAYQVELELPMADLLNMAKKMMPELAGIAGGGAVPGGAAPSTGLAGIGASDPSGGGLHNSVEKLGLKLDPRRMPTEKLIIDHIEKEPTEN